MSYEQMLVVVRSDTYFENCNCMDMICKALIID